MGPNPQSIALTGTGAVALTMAPTALTFNTHLLNTTSAAQVVTVTNALATPVTSTLTISGDYQQSNNCASLAAGASCTVNVTFKPVAAGTRTGVLTINPGGTAQTLSLTGIGSSTAVAVNPTTLAFGNQATATASAVKTVTLTNSQTSALAITSIATNLADYAQTNTCGTSLAASSSCVISVTFTPAVAGSRAGTLTVTTGASTLNVSMSGAGVVAVMLSPTSLALGIQVVGTTSVAKTALLTNNLSTALPINSITVGTNFAETDNCGTALPPGKNCTINLTFAPTASGARNGNVSISVDAASVSPLVIATTGSGVLPQASVLPVGLTFGLQAVATSSAAQTVTVKNNLGTAMTIASVTVTGDFSVVNNCPGSLAGNATCTVNVAFAPTAAGTRTGTLTITDSANNSPQLVTLSGTATLQATAVTVSPASVSLGIGGTQQFTAMATFADSSTLDVTSAATWTSGSPSVASISSTGLASVLASNASPIPITATYHGLTSNAAQLNASSTLPRVCQVPTVDMKILVVNNTTWANYVAFPAVTQILDYLGTPYTVFDIAAHPEGITADFLSDGQCHGYYQGVIFAYGDDI